MRVGRIGQSIRLISVALAGALVVALSACGSASSISTVVSSPTARPTLTATPTTALGAPALCGTDGGSSVTVTGAGTSGIYAADFEHLPDDWTLTPHPLTTASQYPGVIIGSSAGVMVHVSVGAAAQPGIVCGVTVRIKAFQALSGAVPNVYHECVDQVYLDPGGFHPSTACPAFGAPSGEAGLLTLPSSAVGATATAPMDGLQSDFSPDPSHPAQISPDTGHSANYLYVTIIVPTAGTYTFEISLWQNSSAPTVTMPDVTATLLFKQALHEWGGGPCTTSDMQAQLPPPTDPPTQLICPGPPPQ